jgi:hypothetical protein
VLNQENYDEEQIMQITAENYQAVFDPEASTVFLRGNFRLNGLEEYQPVMAVLLDALNCTEQLTLDVEKLDFLNSSGIAVLSKFVLEARKLASKKLVVNANEDITWQSKSLRNLQRLMPALTLNFRCVSDTSANS